MTHTIEYDAQATPTTIRFAITGITQALIDYVVAHDTVSAGDDYTVTVNRSGTNNLSVFDNGSVVLYLAEDTTPSAFSVAGKTILGYGQADYDSLASRLETAMTALNTFIDG